MGSDPSILNSSMEEEIDMGYVQYMSVDSYEYAKPGMRGPTSDQVSLRYPNDAVPYSPTSTFRQPYHRPAPTGIGLKVSIGHLAHLVLIADHAKACDGATGGPEE
jgi:hypothetical protein